jgi:hypothetical protein
MSNPSIPTKDLQDGTILYYLGEKPPEDYSGPLWRVLVGEKVFLVGYLLKDGRLSDTQKGEIKEWVKEILAGKAG